MALMHDGLGDIKNPFSLSCVNEEFASGSVSAWASLSGRQTLCSKQKNFQSLGNSLGKTWLHI